MFSSQVSTIKQGFLPIIVRTHCLVSYSFLKQSYVLRIILSFATIECGFTLKRVRDMIRTYRLVTLFLRSLIT